MTAPFVLDWRPEERILEFTLTGLWTEEEADAWKLAFRRAVDGVPGGKRWFVLADLSNYPPQKEAVQAAHQDCMRYAASRGITKALNVMSKTVIKMQMSRLSGQADVSIMEFCTTRAEAMALIESLRV